MDGEFLMAVVKTLFSLAFVIILIYISVKLGGSSLTRLQDGKFVQVIERVAVSKDNSILVVKLGNRHMLATSTHDRLEIIRELDDEEERLLLERRSAVKLTLLQDLYPNFKRKGR